MSNETQYTPGPWNVKRTNGNMKGWRVDDSIGGVDITGEIRANDGGYSDEAKANARLIAAAPDLLDACKDALATLNQHEGIPSETSDRLASAIAKAEGRDE